MIPGRFPQVGPVRNYDLEFLKRFSIVIGMLVLVSLLLGVAALLLHGQRAHEPSGASGQRIAERLQPVAGVYAGETGAAAMAEAAAAASAATAGTAAFGGSLDGQVIYDGQCAACHTTGAAGAPQLIQAQWDGRLAQGTDTLIRHAIDGYQGSAGLMPARGGNPALSDEQVEASVRWMLDHLQ
jgi:cytochrome c5